MKKKVNNCDKLSEAQKAHDAFEESLQKQLGWDLDEAVDAAVFAGRDQMLIRPMSWCNEEERYDLAEDTPHSVEWYLERGFEMTTMQELHDSGEGPVSFWARLRKKRLGIIDDASMNDE